MMFHFGNGFEVKRHERLLLRPWLENLIDSAKIHGLEWFDDTRTLFRVPWKHQSRKTWSLGHSSVFLEWAKNTGRWKEGDPEPHYAQLKTRLRCAFSKAPDIEEVKSLHCAKAEEPYKVYRFIAKRGSKLYPFGRKAITRKSIHSTVRRNNALPSASLLPEGSSAMYDGEPPGVRNAIEDFKELSPLVNPNELVPVQVTESIQTNEIPYQAENFHGQVHDVSLFSSLPPPATSYPACHTLREPLTISRISEMNFEAADEPMEVNDYYRGKRQTILPPIDAGYSEPQSNDDSISEPKTVSFAMSESTKCVEAPIENLPGFELANLPGMSIMEKVQSWKTAGMMSSASGIARDETACLKSTSEKTNFALKPVECSSWIDTSEQLHQNVSSTTNVQHNHTPTFRELVTADDDDVVHYNQSSYNISSTKKINGKELLTTERSTERNGSNIAIATPIFPLKNRYNISRNCLTEKEKSSWMSLSEHPCHLQKNDDGKPALHDGKLNFLGKEKSSPGQFSFDDNSDQTWNALTMERGSTMQKSFPMLGEKFDNYGRNLQRSVREHYGNWHTSAEQHEGNWHIPGNSHVEAPSEEQDTDCQLQVKLGEESQLLCGGGGKSYDSSWRHYRKSQARNHQLMSSCSAVQIDRNNWSLENTSQADAQCNILPNNLVSEVPLDLSVKRNYYLSMVADDESGMYFRKKTQLYDGLEDSFQIYSRRADSNTRNSAPAERFKYPGSSQAEYGHQIKKFGQHGQSIGASLSHLKAAYKKLVLRTMYVAEKEHELDELEKRLMAQEEAVRLKEQHVQKVLMTLTDKVQLIDDVGKESNNMEQASTRNTAAWKKDNGSWRRLDDKQPLKSRWADFIDSDEQKRAAEVDVPSLGQYISTETRDPMKHALEVQTLQRKVNYAGTNYDLTIDLLGTCQYAAEPLLKSTSHQSTCEGIPHRVLPPIDVCHSGENLYINSNPLESDEFQLIPTNLPLSNQSYCSRFAGEEALGASSCGLPCRQMKSPDINSQDMACSWNGTKAGNFKQNAPEMQASNFRSRHGISNPRSMSLSSYQVRKNSEVHRNAFQTTSTLYNDSPVESDLFDLSDRDSISLVRGSVSLIQTIGGEGNRLLPQFSPDIDMK